MGGFKIVYTQNIQRRKTNNRRKRRKFPGNKNPGGTNPNGPRRTGTRRKLSRGERLANSIRHVKGPIRQKRRRMASSRARRSSIDFLET